MTDCFEIDNAYNYLINLEVAPDTNQGFLEMKRLVLLLICVLGAHHTFAQTRAVTETGDEVILYDDGTWQYQNNDDIEEMVIPINPKLFKKDKSSTFLLKSNKIKIGFWLNSKEWSFKKSNGDSATEYELQLKKEDLRALILTEKAEIPLQSLRLIAIQNAKNAAPDIQIEEEEYRNVNGLNVLLLKMNGTIQGIKFTYYGYYYSGPKGTVQFLTYSYQNLMDKYLINCEKLLNGLVEID